MYLPLNKTGVTNALTEESQFPCPSLVPARNPSFSKFYPELEYQNREYFQTPSQEPEKSTMKHDVFVNYHVEENFSATKMPENDTDQKLTQDLLPVMDCKFNFREICKQCILLEDHLTHDEKRCIDCCMKHFLALEGLSEEAIQLDKDQEYTTLANSLPTKIRKIQQLWHKNPQKNGHECAQMLREIRKQLMDQCFSVVFDNSCSANSCKPKSNPDSCKNGTCKIK
jgi:hypothetical protein